jgi:hypothetical protein
MTRYSKVTVIALTLFFSAFFSASAATPSPRVVFIGDWVTYSWAGAFAANPNWINQGAPGQGLLGNGNSGDTLARFQADVVNVHPAIVHIMIGSSDADEDDDAMYRLTFSNFLSNLDAMVKEARAANIQVILGIEPSNFAFGGSIGPINSIIAGYGAHGRGSSPSSSLYGAIICMTYTSQSINLKRRENGRRTPHSGIFKREWPPITSHALDRRRK